MKRMVIVFLLFGGPASAQSFPVDTLIRNGSPQEMINLVFLGDGYQIHEIDKFKTDVLKLTDLIFSQTPFKQYKNYFNVYAIEVPSNESGATHLQLYKDSNLNCAQAPLTEVDTYFKSTFDNGGFHQLLIPNGLAIMEVILSSFPLYDQIFMIVNTEVYGGSGGYVATSALSVEAGWVSLHEIGHSFVGLADEYWPGPQYAFERPNLTQENRPSVVKWKNWIGINEIGIYEIPGSTGGWYRPHQNCMMQVPGFNFCSVCSETIIEKIHFLTSPVLDYEPSPGMIELNGDLTLRLTTLDPIPNTLRVIWKLNDKTIGRNVRSITIPLDKLNDGYLKKIRAEVLDTTALTRSDSHAAGHLYLYEWTIDGIVTSVESQDIPFRVDLWPNPTLNRLHVEFKLRKPTDVSIQLIDATGRILEEVKNRRFDEGKNDLELTIKEPGMVYLNIYFDGAKTTAKIIRQ